MFVDLFSWSRCEFYFLLVNHYRYPTQTEGTVLHFSTLFKLVLRRDISTVKLPKCSSILSSILASLSRICRSDTFSSLSSISSLLRRAHSLFGDGWDCEEELDVLAALALRLDIKIGFPGVYFTEQNTHVRPPLRRWPAFLVIFLFWFILNGVTLKTIRVYGPCYPWFLARILESFRRTQWWRFPYCSWTYLISICNRMGSRAIKG